MRLVMTTRRFWPCVGGAEIVMANLASYFVEAGHDVTILTARLDSGWPTDLRHRGVQVKRLPHPRTRGWGTIRYLRALDKWIYHHRREFDLVFVSMLKLDAYAAIRGRERHGLPVVIRAEGAGETGDCRWQESARFGQRVRRWTHQANAVIAPSSRIYQELDDAGYDARRLSQIDNGVAIPLQHDRGLKAEKRRIFAEVHGVLEVAPDTPFVVYTGRLDRRKGLLDLIRAWQAVIEMWPQAKLWLVGEGNDADLIWDAIRNLGLVHTVILPGSFDDVGEILQACDCYVLPSYEEGLSLGLLEAMAAGVPVIASDISANRVLIEHGHTGLLTPPQDVDRLAETLVQALQSRDRAIEMADEARRFVQENYSLDRMGQAHLRVFQHCLENPEDGLD